MAVSITASNARPVWPALLDAVKYQDEQVAITKSGKPAAGLVSEGMWRRRAIDLGLDPDDVTSVGVRDSRDEMRGLLARAKEKKATLVVYHPDAKEPDVLAVCVPWSVLGLSEEEVGDLPVFEPASA